MTQRVEIDTDSIYFSNLNITLNHEARQIYILRITDILKNSKKIPSKGYIYCTRSYWFSKHDIQYICSFLPGEKKYYLKQGRYYIITWGGYDETDEFKEKFNWFKESLVYVHYDFIGIINDL